MKKIILICAVMACALGIFLFSEKRSGQRIIGVILPIEHQALADIVAGLKEGLKEEENLCIKVMNAQGDMNIQRAMIDQLLRGGCEIFVPIGTSSSQMTMNLAKSEKIVCLATDLTPEQTKLNATCLSDELSPVESISFLHGLYPKIKKITLVHSASEKVVKEIPLIHKAAVAKGLEVQLLMVQALAELYTIGQAIAKDSGAIFVLKDHLIVSGIQTLMSQAEKRNIPLVTSDEGSIINGGAFAIGVKEAEIGRQGAEIVKMVLHGTNPSAINHQSLKGPYPLFINRKSCTNQNVDIEKLVTAAETLGKPVRYASEGK